MRMTVFLKRLNGAMRRANAKVFEVRQDDSFYARGLATEGYDAGYRDALADVEAVINHGYPTDARRCWKEEEPHD